MPKYLFVTYLDRLRNFTILNHAIEFSAANRGLGQNAAAGVGNAGIQTGQAIANNTMAGANAQAAGTIAAGNQRANDFQTMLGLANTAAKFYTGGMI